MTRRPQFLSMVVLALLAGAVAAPAVCGLGDSDAESGGELRFRRVFAPADTMKDWPRGTERYLPIEAAEFERLLATPATRLPVLRRKRRRGWWPPNTPRGSIPSGRSAARPCSEIDATAKNPS